MAKKYFSCDKCQKKVPFIEVFKFNNNTQTVCNNCNTVLIPKKTISFNWAFFIGFAITTLSAEISLRIYDDFFTAFSIAFCVGSIGIIGIATYTYKTTEFISF